MRNYLEILLEEKTRGLASSVLYMQWEFDKLLVPQALNSISALFPHYSLHNVSHSETIISNIIKVVGEDTLRNFTSTDLWLILEAAYCHDLGMVVTSELIDKAINSGDIQEHINKIKTDNSHDLFKYADQLEITNNKVNFKATNFSLQQSEIVKFILADYFRVFHASNSANYILNPKSALSLNSPRAIIPQRLYEMLGKICETHTKNFGDLFQLPFEEDGVDIDNAHPRLIAGLLRIGDLLDIDNGRFSETLLRTLKDIPESTTHHQLKHMSIKHKTISTEKVELIAICEDKNVAMISQDWFNWINDEFTNQTLTWNNIAPQKYNVSLPTVNQLKVELKGYEDVGFDNNPKFTVDTSQALELLKGANLYDSPLKAIRELLQNSIDSTLIRVWEEKKEQVNNISELLTVAKDYPITVELNSSDNGTTELIINDSGTGISRDDLKFMSAAGSSSKNTRKAKIINEMPIWMQPAGYFGIGFHSSFLLSDLVEITTNSIYSNERFIVEFHNPKSKFKGNIYIKKADANHGIYKYGSSLKMIIDDKRIFDEILSNSFVKELKMNYTFAYYGLLEELRNIAKFSFFPIIINGEKIQRHVFDFVSSAGIELSYDPKDYGCKVCFKNSLTYGFTFKHFKGTINYHSNNSSILNISRKDFKKNQIQNIKKEIIEAFKEFIGSRETKDYYLKLLSYLNSETNNLDFKFLKINQIFQSIGPAGSLSIQEIIDRPLVKFKFRLGFNNVVSVDDVDGVLEFKCGFMADSNIFIDIIIKELGESHQFITYTGYYIKQENFMAFHETEITFSKNVIDNKITIKEIIQIVQSQVKPISLSYLPAIGKYQNLHIKSHVEDEVEIIFGQKLNILYTCILSPLIRVTKEHWIEVDDDSFYELVKERLINQNINIEKIKELYSDLKNELQECIKEVNAK